MLKLLSITAGYGDVPVLHDVSLEVAEGEIVVVIGPNGAGKTTLLKVMSGLLHPTGGRKLLRGRDVTFVDTPEMARQGAVLVPEGKELFGSLTVDDNLRAGTFLRKKLDARARQAAVGFAYTVFPSLQGRGKQRAMTLSGGQQQMCALGRALTANPQLLLLDEPSLGLAPLVRRDIASTLKDLRDQHGISIVMVEQDAHMALSIADRGYLMRSGRIVLEDAADKLRGREEVIESYFGRKGNSL